MTFQHHEPTRGWLIELWGGDDEGLRVVLDSEQSRGAAVAADHNPIGVRPVAEQLADRVRASERARASAVPNLASIVMLV